MTVGQIEAARFRPYPGQLKKLAHAFGLDADQASSLLLDSGQPVQGGTLSGRRRMRKSRASIELWRNNLLDDKRAATSRALEEEREVERDRDRAAAHLTSAPRAASGALG